MTIQSFCLENGEEVLSGYFNVVDKVTYQNDIIIDNIEPVILYLASCYSTEQLEILKNCYHDFNSHLNSVLKKNGGIRITNKNALFKFRKK
jgi:hypothetical protein